MLGVIQKIQSVFQPEGAPQDLGWMNTLTEMSALDALNETRKRLEKIEFIDGLSLKANINLLLEIDEKTYQKIKKITYKYLNVKRVDRELDDEVQNIVRDYLRQLYLLYMRFFELYEAQTKVNIGEAATHLALARLLNAAFMMAKWCYFDDQPAPAGMWTSVHKVIKYAENLALMNKNLFLYNYQIKETSVAAILKRGFMIDTLQKGNFSRLQIHLADEVLKIWSTNPLIVNKYKQDRYHFFIALEHDRGPERVRMVEKFVEKRYWRTTRLADLIEAYLCAVDTGKSLAEFGLDKTASTSTLVNLFKKLRTEWCVEGYARQRRKEMRNKSLKQINVSHGLQNVHQRLYLLTMHSTPTATPSGDFIFDLRANIHTTNRAAFNKKSQILGSEDWMLVDESTRGLAVDLGKKVSTWIEVGKLVGFTAEGSEAFYIAEIKSVRKQKDGTYRAGLAIITKHGKPLQILRLDEGALTSQNGYHVEVYEGIASHFKASEAILVPQANADKTSLIMSRSEYKRGGKYRVQIDTEDKIVTAGRILSKQRDWVLAELET